MKTGRFLKDIFAMKKKKSERERQKREEKNRNGSVLLPISSLVETVKL